MSRPPDAPDRPPQPDGGGAAAAFVLSALASAGFATAYALGGQTQAIGALLAVAFGALAYGLAAWSARLMPPGPFVEEREPLPSTPAERAGFEAELEEDVASIGRRRFLGRTLTLALGTLAGALLFPLRSLGPRPGRALWQTPWRAGALLVTADGGPVRASAVPADGLLTVYPQGFTDAGDAAALLVRVDPAALHPPPGRAGWAPQGLLAHSKLCTHAGCPVGLYEPASGVLFCPCHQSVFDLLQGARPVQGPAARPLPQLPLEIGADGYLRARGDFSGPVGPGFWRPA